MSFLFAQLIVPYPLIWLAAAAVSGLSGNLEMTGLYVLMGAAFGYSAWASWKKAKNDKRGI